MVSILTAISNYRRAVFTSYSKWPGVKSKPVHLAPYFFQHHICLVWKRLEGHTSFIETQYCGTCTENMNAGRLEAHLLVRNLRNWGRWDLLVPETKNLLITKPHKFHKF
jgi:hypothetical protein